MKEKMYKVIFVILIVGCFIFFVMPFILIYMHIYLPKLPNKDNPGNYGLAYENISVNTDDAKTLMGWYIPNETNKGTVLVCHGVGANRSDVISVGLKFHSGGYNVYMFDFRGHGDSSNAKITYGYKERKDIKAIVGYIKSKGTEKIGAYGLSMGGAILMQSLLDNPEIKVIIADSSFASAEKILKYRIGLGIPGPFVNLIADVACFYTKLFYNVPIQKIAPIDTIDQIDRPILFIIGDKDTNITPDNGEMLYKKAKEPKEIFVVKGANHTQTLDSPNFRDKIVSFMDTYLK